MVAPEIKPEQQEAELSHHPGPRVLVGRVQHLMWALDVMTTLMSRYEVNL